MKIGKHIQYFIFIAKKNSIINKTLKPITFFCSHFYNFFDFKLFSILFEIMKIKHTKTLISNFSMP